MKIGIDCRALYLPKLKGIGIYLQNLLNTLGDLHPDCQFTLFYDDRQTVVKRKPSGSQFIEKGISIRKGDTLFFWEQFRLPAELRANQVDIFHSPANTTFYLKNSPTVVTVHDTITQEIHHPNPVNEFYYKVLQPKFLRNAQRVIVPSSHSQNNLIRIMKIDPRKIAVIPQGISSHFHLIQDKEVIRLTCKKFNIAGEYILFSGGESPWKNVSRLIRAYARLKKDRGIPEKLIVTGIRNPKIREQHLREIADLKLTDNQDVFILEYLEENELIALYNGAKVFVYPSYNEGFGFPPLEAMACGAPVAVSRAASMPEIVGDAGLFFDPTDVEDMAEKILDLLTDSQKRESLRVKGLNRVKAFTWEKAARQTWDVYAKLL